MDLLLKLAPLWPAVGIVAYFVVTFAYFAIRSRKGLLLVDKDVERRHASAILGRYFRHYFMWLIRPIEQTIIKLGISPNALTFTSLLIAASSGYAIATGHFAWGGWLYILTGVFDLLDGRVARATNRVSASGAFFDSVMDRYAEMAVFAGYTYFYRDSWVIFAALAATLGSIMVSYARARGEALSVDVNVGMMQRPERLVYMGVSTALAPIFEALIGHGALPVYPMVVGVLILLAVSTNLTAYRRIIHTIAELERRAAPTAKPATVAAAAPAKPSAAPKPAAAVVPLRAAQN